CLLSSPTDCLISSTIFCSSARMAHPPGNRNAAADVATARDRRNGHKRRAEARARPGHERVAVDAMAFEPLADAPPAAGGKKLRLVSRPGSCPSLFPFVAADPPSEGIGGAPRDVQP